MSLSTYRIISSLWSVNNQRIIKDHGDFFGVSGIFLTDAIMVSRDSQRGGMAYNSYSCGTIPPLVVLVALFLYFYLDARVPEPIPEKFKVKVMDAMMKTYGHTVNVLVYLGITEPFSDFVRKIADWFVLTMVTGFPWGIAPYDPRLKITDSHIRDIRVKIYEPVRGLGRTDRPVLIYLHGGGWSLLSVDSYDPLMRKISSDSGTVVISVNYRLSPQYPFPIPLNDCLEVVEYVIENSKAMGIDKSRIAVGGDSAGGNMAAAISLRLKSKIAMQMLLVPSLQFVNFNTTAFNENTMYLNRSIHDPNSLMFVINYLGLEPKYLSYLRYNNHTSPAFKQSLENEYADQTLWLPRRYVRDEKLRENMEQPMDTGDEELFEKIKNVILDPLVSPLLADDELLENLPYTYVMVCGYDFVRDDGIMFYERLNQIEEEAHLAYYPEAFHNALFFPHGPLKLNVGVRIVNDIVKTLKNVL